MPTPRHNLKQKFHHKFDCQHGQVILYDFAFLFSEIAYKELDRYSRINSHSTSKAFGEKLCRASVNTVFY